jgi:hypothetical protein
VLENARQHAFAPSARTALKVAEAFAVPVEALYDEPKASLAAVLEHFGEAPIRNRVEVPTLTLREVRAAAEKAGVEVRMVPPPKRGRKAS